MRLRKCKACATISFESGKGGVEIRVRWVGFGFLIAVQGFVAWVLLGFNPAAEERAMNLGPGPALPGATRILFDAGCRIGNTPLLWIPVWLGLVAILGYALWRVRDHWWPPAVALGLAVAELAVVVFMVVVTDRHLTTWEQSATGGVVRLSSEAELEQLERGLQERIAARRAQSCPRPVLRGQPIEGPASADLVAVVEGADDTAICLDELAAARDRLQAALVHPEGQRRDGWPPRHGPWLRTAGARADLGRLQEACAPLLARIRRAVRHRDACSPYRPGLRGQPDAVTLIRAGRLVALRARGLLAAGKHREAAELLLDGLRLSQDFHRGGTSLLETMVGVAVAEDLVRMLESVLNHPEPLGAELPVQIGSELGILVETQPHPAGFLAGELDSIALYSLLPGVKDDGWQPPGGWGRGTDPVRFDPPPTGVDGIHPDDAVVLGWLAVRRMWREVLSGCRPGDLPVRCQRSLQRVARRSAQASRDQRDMIATMREVTTRSADRKEALRRKIVQILVGVTAPGFEHYLPRQGALLFSLQALRLHAAYRHQAETTGRCPAPAAFDSPAWAKLSKDPYAGEPIRIESLGPGRFALWPTVPIAGQADWEFPPAVFIDCPFHARQDDPPEHR